MMLAARCSLAIAVWLPGPGVDHPVVPEWTVFLTKQGIPPSWIDALKSSVIADFSVGLRIGAFVDVELCRWLPHIPVMRAAKVPIFFRWKDAKQVDAMSAVYPFLRHFAPHPGDAYLASKTPPRPQAPNIFMLYLRGEGRPHPYIADVENRLRSKPAGPFQLPGEKRSEFLSRMAALEQRMIGRESAPQRQRRLDRIAYSLTGATPKPYTRVFLWLKAGLVNPDLPEDMHSADYRTEVHPCAVHGLWHNHGPDFRNYNAVFDEWDLWSDQPEGDLQVSSVSAEPLPLYHDTADIFAAENNWLYHDCPEPDLPAIEFSDEYLHTHYLLERYGLHPDSTTFPDVDYSSYVGDAFHKILGIPPGYQDHLDSTEKKVYSGWISAMMADQRHSSATQCCWDMDPRSPHFLFKDNKVDEGVQVHQVLGVSGGYLYQVVYQEDEVASEQSSSQTWVLVSVHRSTQSGFRSSLQAHPNQYCLPYYRVPPFPSVVYGTMHRSAKKAIDIPSWIIASTANMY
ncbi:hypothetical protein C8Q76DRAFT_697378 [Earliella scabrosa]|nr:hypothetical protein C8Q76DRAFT_697378 [Earliella scabrosa]